MAFVPERKLSPIPTNGEEFKIMPPPAKTGLLSLPIELIWHLVENFLWDIDPARCWDGASSLRQPSIFNLMMTCRRMHWTFCVLLCEKSFDDRRKASRLLGWALVHDRENLFKLGISRPKLDVNHFLSFRCDTEGEMEEWVPATGIEFHLPLQSNTGRTTLEMAPLHLAVICQRPKLVEILTKGSANVEVRDSYGMVPLCYVVDQDTLRVLLTAGASPLEPDNGGLLPLAHLLKGPWIWGSNTEKPRPFTAFCHLLEATRDASPDWSINSQLGDFGDETLLGMALLAGPEYVRKLLEAGADPNQRCVVRSTGTRRSRERETKRSTPLRLALDMDHDVLDLPHPLDSMKLLVTFGACGVDKAWSDYTVMTRIIETDWNDDKYDAVRWLIQEADADPNFSTDKEALCYSVSYFDFISDGPIECHTKYCCQRTPLLAAIVSGDAKMVQLLISLGADVHKGAPPLIMASIMGLPIYDRDSCWEELQGVENLSEIGKMLIENGADPYHNLPRTSSYIDMRQHGASYEFYRCEGGSHQWASWRDNMMETLQFCYRDCGLHSPYAMRLEYEPTLHQIILASHSTSDDRDLDAFNISPSYHLRNSTLDRHQYHRIWTMLHSAVIYQDGACVQRFLDCGVDPLCRLTLPSQMRNTPLGVLIRTRNFHYNGYGPVGPWTKKQVGMARQLLNHGGTALTAQFPPGLMAEFLAQWVARLGGVKNQEKAIREFARLTNHDGRWGPDGISGLLGLVQRGGFWWTFHRRRKGALDDGIERVYDNLLRAARTIDRLSAKDLSRARGVSPNSWWTTRFWEPAGFTETEPQTPPLAETEYHRAFAVLFGEEVCVMVNKRSKKGRGRKKRSRRH